MNYFRHFLTIALLFFFIFIRFSSGLLHAFQNAPLDPRCILPGSNMSAEEENEEGNPHIVVGANPEEEAELGDVKKKKGDVDEDDENEDEDHDDESEDEKTAAAAAEKKAMVEDPTKNSGSAADSFSGGAPMQDAPNGGGTGFPIILPPSAPAQQSFTMPNFTNGVMVGKPIN